MLRLSELAVLAVQNFVFGAFSQIEEFVEIGGCLLPDFLQREASQLADAARGFQHKRRLVTLAAMRHRRKKRTVGFNEHPLERRLLRRLANLLALGKCNVAGKRDHETHIERTLRMRPAASEAMQNSTHAAGFPVLIDQRETILPGILAVFRWPAVDHNRQLRSARHLHLSYENLLLDLARRVIIEVIQPDLPPGNHLRTLR